MSEAQELPRYRCHKIVGALKIAALERLADGSAKIAPVEDGYGTITTDPGFWSRFKGGEADLGYFVVYDDRYQSWSPSKAFEEGYTRI